MRHLPMVDPSPDRAYLEIDILLRDGAIDTDAARELRDNAEAHVRFDTALEAIRATLVNLCRPAP